MKQFQLQELAQKTSARLVGESTYLISGVEELSNATASDASFLANPLYRHLLKTSNAGVICIDETIPLIDGKNYLISSQPTATFQTILKLFVTFHESGFSGIHSTAVIHPTATLGKNITIEPYVVIDAHCSIGDHTIIRAHTAISSDVSIGSHCLLHQNITVREGCKIGNRVIIQPGAVIGSCGYGYTTTAQGEHIKQEQLGIVVLEDDVEIGANTTIDRARFKETRIGRGSKIDNLVQIGHNSHLGPCNLIVSQTGISGSVKTGHHVVMGGQTGTVGHISIADQAMFAARSGIKKSISQKGAYGGNPAIPLNTHQREQVYLRKIPEIAGKLKELESQISALKNH